MNEDSYIKVYEFMISKLRLKGYKLLAFALIHSFSQDDGEYYAGMQYLADWLGTSKHTAIDAVKSLVEDGFISKTEGFRKGKKRGIYKSLFDNFGVKKLHPKRSKNSSSGVKKLHDKGEKTSPNYKYNKDKSETELLPGFDLDEIDRRDQEVDYSADMDGFVF